MPYSNRLSCFGLPRILLLFGWLMMLYRRALSYFTRDWRLISILLVLIALSVGLGLLQAWPTAVLVDAVLTPNPQRGFVHKLFLAPLPDNKLAQVIGVTLIGMVLKMIQDTVWTSRVMLNVRLRNNGVARLRSRLFGKLLNLDATYHRTRPQGDAIFRVSNDVHGAFGILDCFIAVTCAVVTLTVMICTMLAYNWRLTLMALSVTPLMVLVNLRFARTIKARTKESRQIDTDFTTHLQRSMASMTLIQLFGRQKLSQSSFDDATTRSINGWWKLTWQEQLYPLCVNFIYALGGAVIFGYGGYLVYRDQFANPIDSPMTIGILTVFMAYLGGMWDPLRCITGFYANIQGHVAATERVFTVLDQPSFITDRPDAQTLAVQPRTLELRGVGFAYRPGAPVLTSASAHITPGEMVAFIGPSGAGKSTLLNLLPRFYDPTDGQVLLGGIDLRDVRLDDVRRHIALVPQDSAVLPASIADNIAFGRPNASRADIRHAATLAGAHDFITQQPDGYDTILAEGGTNLSGGQRQRLAIARALVTNAPILVLDEPTSALDAVQEKLILQTLRGLKRGRTIIMVTHRMETLRDCDRVLILRNGTIAPQLQLALEAA